uniref:Uncharacterized protein n=1 Tax=Panagrolaimus davidi TaxID=227884 RepID=A0A914PHV6_9BILA
MDQLSTVEDVLSIRRNDRRHSISLNVQIVRVATSDRYKFFTVAVKQFRHDIALRNFSIKCWSADFAVVDGISGGDFVTFTQLWKKGDGRRLSGGYRLNANELDIELYVWNKTTATIFHGFDVGNIVEFVSIRGALTNARVIGRVDSTHFPHTVVLIDHAGTLMEVQTQEDSLNYQIGDVWTFIGNVLMDGGMPVMTAVAASLNDDLGAGGSNGGGDGGLDDGGDGGSNLLNSGESNHLNSGESNGAVAGGSNGAGAARSNDAVAGGSNHLGDGGSNVLDIGNLFDEDL